jgi:hypothetical protein
VVWVGLVGHAKRMNNRAILQALSKNCNSYAPNEPIETNIMQNDAFYTKNQSPKEDGPERPHLAVLRAKYASDTQRPHKTLNDNN